MTHSATPVVTPPSPPSADALEAQGHALLYGGEVQASIPILRRAVAAASPTSLTYAYALFDLAHALRLAGDPRAAVSLLVARLKIDNQTDKVKAELVLALQALARQTGALPSGGAAASGAGPASGSAPAGGNGPPGQAGHGHDHRPAKAPGAPTAND